MLWIWMGNQGNLDTCPQKLINEDRVF
jgi:hypothetical protein